jgi:hypothetical protein
VPALLIPGWGATVRFPQPDQLSFDPGRAGGAERPCRPAVHVTDRAPGVRSRQLHSSGNSSLRMSVHEPGSSSQNLRPHSGSGGHGTFARWSRGAARRSSSLAAVAAVPGRWWRLADLAEGAPEPIWPGRRRVPSWMLRPALQCRRWRAATLCAGPGVLPSRVRAGTRSGPSVSLRQPRQPAPRREIA